jgi:hypothetical protein
MVFHNRVNNLNHRLRLPVWFVIVWSIGYANGLFTSPRAMQFSCLVSPVSLKAPATRRGPSANGLTMRPWRGERPSAPTVLAGW